MTFQAFHKFVCESTEKNVLLSKSFEWRQHLAGIINDVDSSLRGKFAHGGFLIETGDRKTYELLIELGFQEYNEPTPIPLSESDEKWLKVLIDTKDWFEYYEILSDFPHLAGHPLLQKKQATMSMKCAADTKLMDEMCGC